MNREIKFRAWNIEKNQWVDNLLDLVAIESCAGEMSKITFDNTYLQFNQFTGLKDKNGVEIYEGDIVTSDYGLGNNNLNIDCEIVEWEDFYNYKANGMISENIEVIGNIYENPELLEEIDNGGRKK